jgi:hypothetical protein
MAIDDGVRVRGSSPLFLQGCGQRPQINRTGAIQGINVPNEAVTLGQLLD